MNSTFHMSEQAQPEVGSPCPDDSLCGDEFEIINDEQSEIENETASHDDVNSVSHWSIQRSLTIAPFDLNSMSQMMPAGTIGETNPIDAPSITTLNGSTLAKDETPVMDGTMNMPSLHSEGTTASSTPSHSATLEHLLRSQNETRAILESTLKSFAGSIIDPEEVTSLKRQVDELEKKVHAVKEEKETQLTSHVQSSTAEKSAMEEQIKHLTLQLQSQMSANAEMEEKFRALHQEKQVLLASRSESASATNAANAMGQQLYHLGMQVDKREAELAELRAELDAAHRCIADLNAAPIQQLVPTPSLSSNKNDNLARQLDETFAKYHEEKERREVAEDQLRSLLAEQSGGQSFNRSLINEQMIVEQLRNKNSYAERLEAEVERLRHQLEEASEKMKRAVQDAEDQKEIVKILSEDHNEGTRLIAERDHKITSLETILRGLERNQVDNI